MSEPFVTELAVSGMTCAHCARRVNDALSGVAGVASVSIALEDSRARVQWKPGQAAAPANLIGAVQAAGYEAKALSDTPKTQNAKRIGGWGFNVALGACCHRAAAGWTVDFWT